MQISNILPTLMSLVALMFSAYSLYESSLRAPELSTFVAPRIDYVDPDRPEAVREVFIIPATVANDGARSATVLAINLEVENLRTKETKRFYAARLGAWGDGSLKPFAPVALAGKSTFSQALQFEPVVGEGVARILDLEPGGYQLKLTLDIAAPGGSSGSFRGIAPLQFEMRAGQMDYRMFQGTGTMMMWAPTNQSATSGGR